MVSYGLKVITPPAEDAVSLDEAKLWCKVTHAAEDNLILELVDGATKWCQEYTRRQFVTATLRLTLNAFPTRPFPAGQDGWMYPWDTWNVLTLPKSPLISVTSVAYTDPDGASQTFSTGSYQVDTGTEPGLVILGDGLSWPSTKVINGAVSVTFQAGYGAASAVPGGIKAAIKSLVLYWRMHRGDDGMNVPDSIKEMLSLYRTNVLGY